MPLEFFLMSSFCLLCFLAKKVGLFQEYIMRFRPNIDFFVETLFVSAIRKGVDTHSYHPVDAPSPKHRHCK
jgi:hypothetical protein